MKKSSDLNFEKIWLLFQETDKKIRETDRILTEKFQETDRKFQETDKKLRQLKELFTGQWGKLVESLVEGNLIKLLKERGIDVHVISNRVRGTHKNKKFEFDILAKNNHDIVVVEVKTTLRVSHINEFIDELKLFKKIFPEYKNKNIYGAIAFLRTEESAEKYAYKKGLFVIQATNESAKILNDEKLNLKNGENNYENSK